MARVVVSATILVLALATRTAARQDAPNRADYPPTSTAVVVKYADGKARYDLVSEKPAWFWTPSFPRIESWTAPPGTLPVTALQVWRQFVGRDARVVVSVLRGRSHEEEQPVATIMLSGATHVTVRELRVFGVQPIEIWLADAALMTPFLPTVLSASPEVEVSAVELLRAPYPGYRITLRNLSSQSMANVRVQAYRGDEKALSATPRAPGGHAVAPGASFSFDINLTTGAAVGSGGWSPNPLDVIDIDSVMWEDGTITGDTTYALSRQAIAGDAGRRVQLSRAVEILRAAEQANRSGAATIVAIRSGFDALPDRDDTLLSGAQHSLRGTKGAILADLARFIQDQSVPHDAGGVRRWIRYTIERYEGWIRRLSP